MRFEIYDTYKSSETEWLEQIPEHWQEKRIKDLSALQSGINITSDQIEEEDKYPVYGGNGLRGYFSKYTNEGDYILIGRQGALCGNINYASGKFWATEHAVVVYLKPNIDWKWYGEMLRVMNLNQYSVSAAQPGLSVDRIKRLLLPFPTLDEQKAIARYLDTKTAQIDRKIDLLTQKAQRYEELKKSLINETVTRGLDKSVPMKDSGIEWIGKIPEHWDISAVKRLVLNQSDVVQTGPFGAQLHASDYVDEGIPLILIRNVKELWIDDSDIPKITVKKAEQLSMYRLRIGDIVFSRVGSIGRIALVSSREEGWMISGQMLRLRIKNRFLHMKYLIYAFTSEYVKYYMSLQSLGSTRESINTEILSNCILLVPSYEEQVEIADHLDTKTAQIDQIIQTINTQIQKLKELRKTLINDVVTGKIKVIEN